VQVSIRETNESEPFDDASLKTQESHTLLVSTFTWDKSVGCLMTERTATGAERA
jgi:hypothetical protein